MRPQRHLRERWSRASSLYSPKVGRTFKAAGPDPGAPLRLRACSAPRIAGDKVLYLRLSGPQALENRGKRLAREAPKMAPDSGHRPPRDIGGPRCGVLPGSACGHGRVGDPAGSEPVFLRP